MLLKNVKDTERITICRVLAEKVGEQQISIAKLAKLCKNKESRVRIIVDMLIKEGVLNKVVTKDFSKQYKRYYYEVIKCIY